MKQTKRTINCSNYLASTPISDAQDIIKIGEVQIDATEVDSIIVYDWVRVLFSNDFLKRIGESIESQLSALRELGVTRCDIVVYRETSGEYREDSEYICQLQFERPETDKEFEQRIKRSERAKVAAKTRRVRLREADKAKLLALSKRLGAKVIL